jgi:hypothetical protein
MDALGQTTSTAVRTTVFPGFFVSPGFPFYPSPGPFPFPSTMPFVFEVNVSQPVHRTSQTFLSWDEAVAFAASLWNRAQNGEFGPIDGGQVQVTIRDSRGVTRMYPEQAQSFQRQLVAYRRRDPRRFSRFTRFPRSGTVTLAGPYGHLESGTLGQRPVEVVGGAQVLAQELRDYAVGVLATLYSALELNPPVPAIEQSGVFSGLTFYTAEAYAARFPDFELPSPGLQGASPGQVFVINVDELVRYGQALEAQTTPGQFAPPQDTIRVVVAPDAAQAATIAEPGSEWALLQSAPIAPLPREQRRLSPGVIAAGIAATAVAAFLLFA